MHQQLLNRIKLNQYVICSIIIQINQKYPNKTVEKHDPNVDGNQEDSPIHIEEHFIQGRRGSKTPMIGKGDRAVIDDQLLTHFKNRDNDHLYTTLLQNTQASDQPHTSTSKNSKSRNAQMKYSTYSKQASIAKSTREYKPNNKVYKCGRIVNSPSRKIIQEVCSSLHGWEIRVTEYFQVRQRILRGHPQQLDELRYLQPAGEHQQIPQEVIYYFGLQKF